VEQRRRSQVRYCDVMGVGSKMGEMTEERIIVVCEASHMPLKYTDIEEPCVKAFTRN
jgi:hypothetical protein